MAMTKSLEALQLECAKAEKSCMECDGEGLDFVTFDENGKREEFACDWCKATGKLPRVPGLRRECPEFMCMNGIYGGTLGSPSERKCGKCEGRGWLPATSLSDAMMAARNAGFTIDLCTYQTHDKWGASIFLKDYKDSKPHMADTPDLAFWSALHEAIKQLCSK